MGYHYAIDSWTACNTSSWFRLQVVNRLNSIPPHWVIILAKLIYCTMCLVFVIFRTIDPTKIIITGKRVRFSFIGISDIIYFDPNQTNQAAAIANYQQVGKLKFSQICTNECVMSRYAILNWIEWNFTGRLNVTWKVSISIGLQMSPFGARGTNPIQHFSCVKDLFIRFTKLSSVCVIDCTACTLKSQLVTNQSKSYILFAGTC